MTDIAGRIFCIRLPTNHLLASTFLRFQEHYESAEFRGRVFTWEEFMDWYAHEYGEFTYLSDWCGFNLPDTAFDAFRRGDFDPLTRKERLLLDAVADCERPFYVIGVVSGESDVLVHEFAHALFYLDETYRGQVRDTLSRYDLSAASRHLLKTEGYGANVLDDELNAYLLTGPCEGWPRIGMEPPKRALQRLFERTFGYKLWTADGRERAKRLCRPKKMIV